MNRTYPLAPVWVAAFTLVAGCAGYQEKRRTEPPVAAPPAWSQAELAAGRVTDAWLDHFDDPDLREIINAAMTENFDLRAAAARVEAARAQAMIDGADRLPQISAALNGARSKRNATGGQAITSTRSNTFSTGLDIAWEADIWGRLGDQARAAVFELQATETDLNAARLSLAANIARSWFDAKEGGLLLALAEQTVSNFEKNRDTIEEGFRDGINSALEVRLSRANVAGAQSEIALQRARRNAAVRSLEILAGRYPAGKLIPSLDMPAMNRQIPSGIPSELLNRRPDIAAAEMRLAAADQRTAQARKNRLPSFRLTASGGTSTGEFKDLLDSDFLIYTIAANLGAPIFQGGRLRAEQERAAAGADELLATYAQTLLRAFREVETALSNDRQLADQEIALRTAREESIAAEQLALEQYRAGLVDIITLLEAQRRSFNSQNSLIQVSTERVRNRIDLYLALGGNFASDSIAGTRHGSGNSNTLTMIRNSGDETAH
ncbi:MAG: efflux transporter outer membrane subunit [Gammaproteobacteria bacterium]|nr:efflux transporter outer membrane subunit [Gammaproteobacteria bacterium]